ncbi:MAG TPA: hypothetical protein VJ111_08630 [Chitinophagaceae bacterium]|nr:hypothetical protein [Chitinophagaceae bacterium]
MGVVYTGYSILKVPKIIIDQNFIAFKSPFKADSISWGQIRSISLTGKRDRGFMLDSAEVSILHLNDGKEIIIWASFYKNICEIRTILEKVNTLIKENKPLTGNINLAFTNHYLRPLTNPLASSSQFIKYAGNPHTSFNGLLFYFLAAFIISIPFTSTKPFSPIAFVLLTPILMMYLGLGHQLHYFLISEDTLVVKNHFWLWKKHIYNLEEIREIIFEKPGRWTKSVRIITHDFREKLYPAGSLRSRNWKELKIKLGELNIVVRNDSSI